MVYSYIRDIYGVLYNVLYMLQVPKCENFSLAFFTLSEPICVADLRIEPKNPFFYHLTPDFECFWFFLPHTECTVNKNKKLS
jgi:hypothetical protein